MTNPAEPGSRVAIDWSRALVPLSLGFFALLYFWFEVPLWVLGLLVLWIPIYYLGFPIVVRRRWQSFEREFETRRAGGNYNELLAFFESQRFLRQFGPEANMLGRLGQIYLGLDKAREAEAILERVQRAAPVEARPHFLVDLAHARFLQGKYDEASQMYTRILSRAPHQALARTRLAIIDLHKGRRTEVARRTLEQALGSVDDEDRARIEAALSRAA